MNLPDAIAAHVGDRRPVPVTDGQSGAEVYRFVGEGTDRFLKVGRGVARDLVEAETARLRWLVGRLPAPVIVAAVVTDDAAWLLTSAIPGVPAGDYIKADRAGRSVPIARQMAAFLQRLHDLPTADCPFDSGVAGWLPVVRRLVADDLVDVEDFDPEHAGWSAARVLARVEELAGHARGAVVLHGDFSLGNLIVGADGTIAGCIDVGRLGVGDPYRDIFIGWRDLGGFGEAPQRAFLDALDMDGFEEPRRALRHALDELF
ncbi:APH(3') family aminoglycoside O-phosphotransferase [Sphingomonas phyllosphaerae]|uniref:APH(3') family aminoglycoside O-phosphotransferase n=1 Tax=Sphingomonas phyllosphaerae TaxID=257003 RepID=UPI0004066656|nr:APH(3') family aminoglycoside O-phosphotransferase [Sphingomonas phyllosphaerae]